MKKGIAISLSACVLCSIMIAGQMSPPAQAANIDETSNKIRVTIGNTEIFSPSDAKSYNNAQTDLLNTLSSKQPASIGSALITFDKYLSASEAAEKTKNAYSINTVYIWIPGEDGRSIITVENNDIEAAIQTFFSSFDIENEPDSDYKNDMISLINNYGVFAVEVKETYGQLQEMSSNNNIARVDLIHSDEAHALSSQTGKEISYICIPEKPDGTK